MRREPFTPLHVAHTHLLAGGEESMLRGRWEVVGPMLLEGSPCWGGGGVGVGVRSLGALPSRGDTSTSGSSASQTTLPLKFHEQELV